MVNQSCTNIQGTNEYDTADEKNINKSETEFERALFSSSFPSILENEEKDVPRKKKLK